MAYEGDRLPLVRFICSGQTTRQALKLELLGEEWVKRPGLLEFTNGNGAAFGLVFRLVLGFFALRRPGRRPWC